MKKSIIIFTILIISLFSFVVTKYILADSGQDFTYERDGVNGYSFNLNGHVGRTWSDDVDAISYFVEGVGGGSFSLSNQENFMYWDNGKEETYFNVDGYTGRMKQDYAGVISYQFDDLGNGEFTIEDVKNLINESKKSSNSSVAFDIEKNKDTIYKRFKDFMRQAEKVSK